MEIADALYSLHAPPDAGTADNVAYGLGVPFQIAPDRES